MENILSSKCVCSESCVSFMYYVKCLYVQNFIYEKSVQIIPHDSLIQSCFSPQIEVNILVQTVIQFWINSNFVSCNLNFQILKLFLRSRGFWIERFSILFCKMFRKIPEFKVVRPVLHQIPRNSVLDIATLEFLSLRELLNFEPTVLTVKMA